MKMNDIKNNCSNYCRGLATTKELMNPEKGRARFRIRSTMPLLVIGKYHLGTNTFSFFVATIFVMRVTIILFCIQNESRIFLYQIGFNIVAIFTCNRTYIRSIQYRTALDEGFHHPLQ